MPYFNVIHFIDYYILTGVTPGRAKISNCGDMGESDPQHFVPAPGSRERLDMLDFLQPPGETILAGLKGPPDNCILQCGRPRSLETGSSRWGYHQKIAPAIRIIFYMSGLRLTLKD